MYGNWLIRREIGLKPRHDSVLRSFGFFSSAKRFIRLQARWFKISLHYYRLLSLRFKKGPVVLNIHAKKTAYNGWCIYYKTSFF